MRERAANESRRKLLELFQGPKLKQLAVDLFEVIISDAFPAYKGAIAAGLHDQADYA